MYIKSKFVIVGSGGIGRAAALMLSENRELDVELFIGDVNLNSAKEVVEWVKSGSSAITSIEAFHIDPKQETEEMKYIFSSAQIILDCLPGSEAPRMAKFALQYNLHYVNLTEYVKETDEIIALASNASTGFVLQSGLAPGYINILAHQLYKQFLKQYGGPVKSISMKVGALTKMTQAPHFYGFTWSPIGVATEYVKDAIVIKNGVKTTVPALSQTTRLILDGIQYEDDYTSGGAANLPDYFQGKVESLDYKTIRFPGHYDWIRSQIQEIGTKQDVEQALLAKMIEKIPHTEDDMIVLYVSVTGFDQNNTFRIKEKNLIIEPSEVGGYLLKAIQTCTVAPMLEAARMLLTGQYKGVILQSDLDPDQFLNGPFIQKVYQAKKATGQLTV